MKSLSNVKRKWEIFFSNFGGILRISELYLYFLQVWLTASLLESWLDPPKWLWRLLTKDCELLCVLALVVDVVEMRLLFVGDFIILFDIGGCEPEFEVEFIEVELLLLLFWSCCWACSAAATCKKHNIYYIENNLLSNRNISLAKGSLISESFALWLQSPKKVSKISCALSL